MKIKKYLVFISCFVMLMSFSMTAFATPSPQVEGETFTKDDKKTDGRNGEVLGDQFTNPNGTSDETAQVLGESWMSNGTSGDENSAVSPKTSDSNLLIYVSCLGIIISLTTLSVKKKLTA